MHYSTAKEKLLSNGYLPLPIYPNDKSPAIKNWASPEYTPPAGYGGYGVGIICGRGKYPIAGIDVDVTDPKLSEQIVEKILGIAGETIYRVGKEPKTLLVYRFASALRKKISKKYDIGRIEILGEGQQFVSFGTHPDTKKPYSWPNFIGDVSTVPAESLPLIDSGIVEKIIDSFEDIVEKAGYKPKTKEVDTVQQDYDPDDPLDEVKPIGLTVDRCQQVLEKVDPDCERDQWRNIGMALHFEFGGDEDGFRIWDTWSAGGSKYKKGEPERQWESFGKYSGRPITGAYLLKLGKEEKVETDFFKSLNWSTKRFTSKPPELPMLVDGFLPLGIVSLFYSAGGAGKSTLVLYLAVKIALANKYEVNFLGHQVNPAKVAIITAEDPDLILNRRFIGILEGVADELQISLGEVRNVVDEYLSIVSTFGHAVSLFKITNDGILRTTKYYESLVNALKDVPNLQFVVIDTKTRFSPGEGLGNVTATQEITHYEAIAQQTGASIMLLHHSNKSSRDGSQTGAQAYRDATAIFDSVRAAWYLRALRPDELAAQGVKEEDHLGYLLLENSKNNYIKCCNDALVTRDGFKYSSIAMSKKLSKLEVKEKKVATLRESVMDMLQNAKGQTMTQLEFVDLGLQRGIARKLMIDTLKQLDSDGALHIKEDGHRKVVELTKAGATYNLEAPN